MIITNEVKKKTHTQKHTTQRYIFSCVCYNYYTGTLYLTKSMSIYFFRLLCAEMTTCTTQFINYYFFWKWNDRWHARICAHTHVYQKHTHLIYIWSKLCAVTFNQQEKLSDRHALFCLFGQNGYSTHNFFFSLFLSFIEKNKKGSNFIQSPIICLNLSCGFFFFFF